MPIVTIQITREGTSPEQKAALIQGVTDLLSDVLNKPPALTFVVIQEIDLEDWGVGGLPVLEYRRQQSQPSAASLQSDGGLQLDSQRLDEPGGG
ncbi:MAG TPA: 4-oxalocrotonate tautomerase family protein [Caulifigura sp.]|jgi:4-oxalocrotonate tautomerase|nr:4-oxalocrotonate tautomerase family protein [Caulifigura sp.]